MHDPLVIVNGSGNKARLFEFESIACAAKKREYVADAYNLVVKGLSKRHLKEVV